MTDAERQVLRAATEAMVEARRRAKTRGLTNEEIEREEDDDDSQYWDDVREIGAKPRTVTH
jgi:hypothetical protein